MSQLNLHKGTPCESPLNSTGIPIISKLADVYKQWHLYIQHIPKITRHTLGQKIDNCFTDCIELALRASHEQREEKVKTLQELNTSFDTLKFFLHLLWEVKAMNTNKFTEIAHGLNEIGRMIGGWMKHTR